MKIGTETKIHQLEEKAHRLEDEMKYEFFKLRKSSKRIVTISLLAAGGALAAVMITKLLSKDERRESEVIEEKRVEKEPEPKVVESHTGFSSRLKTAMVAVAMEVGRQKLVDFLKAKFDDTKPSE